ncbi:hypothetical protein AURDEDRAFT_127640 [Auricularia subglabra TFB-10046 SS5]|nr:hypothetical protein AURDEDRAFT_127640 [Auricularia subglabra TFB-10046 SS5]
MSPHATATRSRSNVDSLPEELLREIMLIDTYTPSDWVGNSASAAQGDAGDLADGDLYDVQKKVNLSQVSRRWRRVALENSRLWASFCIGIGIQDYSDMIDALLARSGAAPLNVALFICGSEDPCTDGGWHKHPPELYKHIAASLARQVARIRSLCLNLRGTVETLRDLLDANLEFSALHELRIVRDWGRKVFTYIGHDDESCTKHFLRMTMTAPALEVLDLMKIHPASVDERLLHAGLTTVRLTGHIYFDSEVYAESEDNDSKQHTLPMQALSLMAKVFRACPTIRSFSLSDDYRGVDPLPDVLCTLPLDMLDTLVLEFGADDLVLILDHLMHTFVPNIRIIAFYPLEFGPDTGSGDGYPLLTRLLRGMGRIVEFDIWSLYTVTLRDAHGNQRTLGTSEWMVEYIGTGVAIASTIAL